MTRVSIASVRVSNPSVAVTVVCDAVSGTALQRSCDPLLNEVDELVVSETPDGDAGYRSRHVKTRLREVIEGPFLFLDCDTFVRGDLSPIFSLDTDIAGARNHSRDEFREQIWEEDARAITSMKWRLGEEAYINSGVLFYNDTPGTYRFASLWHQKWLDWTKQRARYRDQPALNAALFEAQPRLNILSHRFNAQFRTSAGVAKNAIVWHFYSSLGGPILTGFDELVQRLLQGDGEVFEKQVQALMRQRHPWRRQSILDDLVARVIMAKGRMDLEDQLWFEARRWQSVRHRARRYLSRVPGVVRSWYLAKKGLAVAASVCRIREI
jgi:hypothetical protein